MDENLKPIFVKVTVQAQGVALAYDKPFLCLCAVQGAVPWNFENMVVRSMLCIGQTCIKDQACPGMFSCIFLPKLLKPKLPQ